MSPVNQPVPPFASPWWGKGHAQSALTIEGGRPLRGTYPVSGAKNAVLPLMVSALLTPNLVTLHNVPRILDVGVLSSLLQQVGAVMHWSEGARAMSVTIGADRVRPEAMDHTLVTRMRASVLLLGALLARCGHATLPLPGGDAIGQRGIDFHIAGLRAMGADIAVDNGMVRAVAPDGLHGAEIDLPFPSVGATENLIIAAAGASGTTVIRNAAREPEVENLVACIRAMGVPVEGMGSPTLAITGVSHRSGAVQDVIPDRIELGTMACAAAITGGELLLQNGRLDVLGAAVDAFAAAGLELVECEDGVRAQRGGMRPRGVDIVTHPFPGFATDLQAPMMALLATCGGTSSITETVFERRFAHADELRRMGADITVRGRTAMIRSVRSLAAAEVTGTDVRAAAALLIAALGARGRSRLDGIEHLHRGYDGVADKLRACGAAIDTVSRRPG